MDSFDKVLNRVAVETLLSKLSDEARLVVALTFGLEYPEDWPWPESRWPPIHAEVGWYVGNKLRGRPISEATVRYIRLNALQDLQEYVQNPGKSRQKSRKSPQKRKNPIALRVRRRMVSTYR